MFATNSTNITNTTIVNGCLMDCRAFLCLCFFFNGMFHFWSSTATVTDASYIHNVLKMSCYAAALKRTDVVVRITENSRLELTIPKPHGIRCCVQVRAGLSVNGVFEWLLDGVRSECTFMNDRIAECVRERRMKLHVRQHKNICKLHVFLWGRVSHPIVWFSLLLSLGRLALFQ